MVEQRDQVLIVTPRPQHNKPRRFWNKKAGEERKARTAGEYPDRGKLVRELRRRRWGFVSVKWVIYTVLITCTLVG